MNLGPNLADKISKGITRNPTPINNNPSTCFISPVNDSDLVKIAFECLKPNKAAGYGGFRPSVVRKVIVSSLNP